MASWPAEVQNCKASSPTPWTAAQWANKTFVIDVCGPLQSNSDVAGIGVLAAFVGTCIITIAASLVKAFCLGIVSRDDNGFRELLLPGGKPIWKWMTEHRAIFWNDILGKLILGLADQQMVTGFAILVATFHNKPKLTAYHFFFVSTIAAFSCLTQSIALLVIFDVMHRSLFLHSLRVLVYNVVLGMFYYAAFSSHDLTGDQGYKAMCPAECDFEDAHTHYVEIIFAGLPVYAFIMLDLLRKYAHHFGMLAVMHDGDGHEREYRGLRGWRKAKSWLRWNGFQFLRVFAWVYCLGELGYSLWAVMHSWGLNNYTRGGLYINASFDQGQWGFGQLTAVILIALPFMAVINEWREKLDEEDKAKDGLIPYAGFPGRDSGGIHRQGTVNNRPRTTYFAGPTAASIAIPDPVQASGSYTYKEPRPSSIPMQDISANGHLSANGHGSANGHASANDHGRVNRHSRPSPDTTRPYTPSPASGSYSPSSPRPGYSPSPARGSEDEWGNTVRPTVTRKPLPGWSGR